MMTEDRRTYTHSWDAMPGEDTQAFAAFTRYLSQGPKRSLRYTAKVVGKSQATVERWSTRYDWKERARAFDEYRNQQRGKAMLAAVKTSAAREVEAILG